MKVDKTQFKVGSLDQLMELMDTFSKYDLVIDGACKRNEKMYIDLCKDKNQEPDLKLEVNSGQRRGQANKMVTVAEYMQTFKWDQVRFQMDKSLKALGTKIQLSEKTCADRLKKKADEVAAIKNKLQALTKKFSKNNYMQTDLEVLVYEKKIPSQFFVNMHYPETNMTTILCVIPKKKIQEFESTYQQLLLEHNAADKEMWEKRKKAEIVMAHQNIENDDEREEITAAEYRAACK